MQSSSLQIEKKLEGLKAGFSARLQDDLKHFEVFLFALNMSDKTIGNFSAFHTRVHKLAGIAGSYGHPNVSLLATELDRYLSTKANCDFESLVDDSEFERIFMVLEEAVYCALNS